MNDHVTTAEFAQTVDAAAALRAFLADGRFAARGAFITDLDGTAVLEREGRIFLPPEIESGLVHVRDRGRPVIANTLRFPRSVISVFGDEWHRATGTDLPLVSMKGSQFGRVTRSASGETVFDEWGAVVLDAQEIDEIMAGVRGLVAEGIDQLLVFHYARDWRKGERIWTPDPSRIPSIEAKYRSASHVHAEPLDALDALLRSEPACMVFLLVDVPEDRRMAYQHTQRASFFTHRGTDKRSGAEAMARHLGIDLEASIGAGDAPPDDFLDAVGFAILVGAIDVPYRGRSHTVRVPGIPALGTLLAVVGESV